MNQVARAIRGGHGRGATAGATNRLHRQVMDGYLNGHPLCTARVKKYQKEIPRVAPLAAAKGDRAKVVCVGEWRAHVKGHISRPRG